MKSISESFILSLKDDLAFSLSAQGIKYSIGDSVNNNRTASIRQCVKYYNDVFVNSATGAQLAASYELLREKGLFKKLRKNNNRTDAYDINEYFRVFEKYVSKDRVLKSQVSKLLNNVRKAS